MKVADSLNVELVLGGRRVGQLTPTANVCVVLCTTILPRVGGRTIAVSMAVGGPQRQERHHGLNEAQPQA